MNRAWLAVAAATVLSVPGLARAEEDTRPLINLRELAKQHYEVVKREDLKGIGQGLMVVEMAVALPEAEGQGKGLERISRLFVLDGDRITFDSFRFDGIPETGEPSVNSRTFFQLQWSVLKGAKGKNGQLMLKGIVPMQDPGEKVRTGQRVLVLSYHGVGGFETEVDAVSARPATVGPGEVRIPLEGK